MNAYTRYQFIETNKEIVYRLVVGLHECYRHAEAWDIEIYSVYHKFSSRANRTEFYQHTYYAGTINHINKNVVKAITSIYDIRFM